MPKSLAALVACLALVLAGAGLSAPVAAAPVSTKAKPVTLQPIPAKSEAGRTLSLRGKVAGGKATVKIQRKYAGAGWQTVATTKSTKKGNFATKVKLTQGGPTSFRALRGKLKSEIRSLDVYQWLDLVNQRHVVGGPLVLSHQDSRIGGRTFPRSIEYVSGWGGFGGGLAIDTGGACSRFEVHSGFLDSERAGLPADAVQQIGVVLATPAGTPVGTVTEWTTPVGPAVRRTVSVSGADVMILNLGTASATPPPTPVSTVLGKPRVYCNSARLPSLDSSFLMARTSAKRAPMRWTAR